MAQCWEHSPLTTCEPGLFPCVDAIFLSEFVVGSCRCSEGFSPDSWFSSLHKNNISKFEFDPERTDIFELSFQVESSVVLRG